jgi:hypothetical protein
MSSIDKGRRNQLKTRRLLEAVGYQCETAKFSRWGSTDFWGLWDIIAIDKKNIKLVQVKSNRLPSPEDREQYELFECPSCVSKELWIWYDYKNEPRIIKIN